MDFSFTLRMCKFSVKTSAVFSIKLSAEKPIYLPTYLPHSNYGEPDRQKRSTVPEFFNKINRKKTETRL